MYMETHFDEKHSRREFFGTIVKVGLGAVAATALLSNPVLAVVDGDNNVVAEIKLADYKDKLANVGDNILIPNTSVGDILVIRLADDKYSVLSNICPHKQCKVKVKSADLIQCPCHRSSYALDGTYRYGPSHKNLTRFPFVVKDGNLIISDTSK